jgi:hypothetical protein
MAVFGIGGKSHKVAVVRSIELRDDPRLRLTDVASSRFSLFWDLMDTIKIHGYVRAAMGVIGRSAVGAWWTLRKHEEFGSQATERQRRRLMRFYLAPDRQWDNIKDFQSIAYKLMIGAMYLRYFGQAAYKILRNAEGQPIGFDHLPGYVVPNIDKEGYFKSPAFYQYPSRNPKDRVEFRSQRDIVFITNPDFEGYPSGGSDTFSLAEFALPLDIYLQTAAREYLKNRNTPEGFYILSADTSDEAFDEFVKSLEAMYSGPTNLGRNPIAVKGDLDFKQLRPLPEDLPYQEARSDVREEVMAVSGTPGAKLGLTSSMASANLREMRREFHEATMVPLFRLIEVGLWEQLHMREFEIRGWEIRFNSPDFLNAVERATVHLRYKQMGVLNANEVRYDLGKPRRTDPVGDRYEDEDTGYKTPNPQGNPPEGRPVDPDDPSQTGEPNMDADDPERGDQHDDTVRALVLRELRQWRTFAVRRMERGKLPRAFNTEYVPEVIRDVIQQDIAQLKTPKEVREYFAWAERTIAEELEV